MTMYLGLGRNSAAFLIDVYQSEFFSLYAVFSLILFVVFLKSESMHGWLLLFTSQTGWWLDPEQNTVRVFSRRRLGDKPVVARLA